MEQSKSNFLVILTLVILAMSLLGGCAQKDDGTKVLEEQDYPTRVSSDTDPIVEKLVEYLTGLAKIQDFEGISASIYWFDSELRFSHPRSLKDLLEPPSKTIFLEGDEIKGKLDLFSEIKTEDIQHAQLMDRVDARFYMIIDSSKDGKLFDFLLFGDNGSYIINGIQIERNPKLTDIIMPFLDFDGRFDLRGYR